MDMKMIEKKPEISVLMAMNRIDSFTESAILSILNQTFKNFEFLIILNGKEANKIKMKMEKYQKLDNRIKIHTTKISQLQYNLNYGLDVAQADIIARMDSDDISDLTRFEKQYQYLVENTIDILGTDFTYIDEQNNRIDKKSLSTFNNDKIRKRLAYHCVFCHPTLMFKKDVVLNIGGYCFGSTSEDWDLFLRLSRNSEIKFDILNEKLLKYRVHDKQMSKQNIKISYLMILFLYLRELIVQKKIKFLKGLLLYLLCLTPVIKILKNLRK